MKKRLLSSIFRFHYVRKLRKGLTIVIIPSYDCNFKCSYCARNQYGKHPDAEMKTLEAWQFHLTNLDKSLRKDRSRIKSIILSGGEPIILPYFVELCEWILDQGWMLDIFTNLSSIKALQSVRQTTNIIIHASHHPEGITIRKFVENWRVLDKKHRVEVREMGERRLTDTPKKTHLFPYSDISPNKEGDIIGYLRIDPNLNTYYSCEGDVRANIK